VRRTLTILIAATGTVDVHMTLTPRVPVRALDGRYVP
jgi:hypothetical protein